MDEPDCASINECQKSPSNSCPEEEKENIERVCFICKSSSEEDTKLKSVEKTIPSLKNAANIRAQQSKDKFQEVTTIILNNDELNRYLYHPLCHRLYTAVKRSLDSNGCSSSKRRVETRTISNLPQTGDRGKLSMQCIFCGKKRKKKKGKEENLLSIATKEGCDTLFDRAHLSENEKINSLIKGNVDLIAKEGKYHKSCRIDFLHETNKKAESKRDTSRCFHMNAFKLIASLIEHEVVQNEKSMLISSLLEQYKEEYCNSGGNRDDVAMYASQNLTRKIAQVFVDKVCIRLVDNKRGNFLYNANLSEERGRALLFANMNENNDKIVWAAKFLRSKILQLPKSRTPDPASVQNLKECSPDIPEQLNLFFRSLLGDTCFLSLQGPENVTLERKASSMASDAIFNVTHGNVKPWKHIAMGLGMTSLTGSKLAIQILNRAGHSISYSEAKGLETEFAYSVSSDGNSAPDGIQLLPNRATACVWDNNDANIETLDGKSTLHSTVGHTYQNIYEGDGENLPEIRFREEKKRRTYIGIQQEILPYRKSLKTASFVLDTDGMEDSAMWPGHYVTELDLYWLLRLSKGEVPLYAGYMSNFITDPLPLQRISYMDPISKSPTDNAVVRETMIRTMNVAKETGQEYAIVTYDLAVALKAYSIQALDSPLFDKLLIMLGNFHIELAFFGAVGTLINESGIEFILAESDVLAEGSMLGFFKGKFYNRCVRIHEIVSNVLEQKLYDRFLQEISFDEYQIVHELFCNISDKCALKDQLSDPIISLHVKKYNDFFQSVIEGACGPTAKFWGIYIYLINRVHRQIQRCIKTNDVDGYITTFPAMLDVFFSLNRPNYARWGTLFLQKLTSSDPAIRDILKQGAFTVRRTKKNYSRSAVDISLEQTVNRDAASNLRGIVSFRNSENAIRRWHLTMTQRAMAVMELRSLAGLEVGEHAAAQCQPSRIRRDYKQMQALSEKIEEFCNPFNVESNNFLVNLATGRAANDETKNYLLGTLERGKTARENFKNEWLKDPSRFLKPVKRITVENFATEVEKRKKTLKVPLEIKEKKNAESLKDMFIRLVVAVAEKTNYNLLHVIQYPITTYPLSLAHPDGTPLKTQKSALLKRLESFQKYHLAVANDNCIHIFDGGLVMHSVLSNSNAGASFGSIATSILSMICSGQHNSPVHICFDKYVENSIKSSERKLRGATNTLYFITGADQRIRSRGDKLLLNANFKNELGKFLITEWQKDHYWSFLLGKTVTASFGGNCVTLEPNEENGIVVSHPDHLQGDHEEADTLIAFHVSKLVMTNPVIVRASDTDILVILINMLSKLCLNACSQSEIIMDCGVGNNRRYINVSEIVSALEELKPGLAGSLIGYHAFTGCDFTAAFYRKGKVKHLEILSKDETGKFINFFSGMRNIDNEINIEVASEFVCRMYGETGADVDVARHRKLVKMAGSAGKDNPLANIRRIDCALLPPTRRCLEKKLLRSKYVSIIWDRADSASPCQQITPLDYGWSIHDNFLFPTWFDGPSVPECLFPENETEDQESEEFEDEPWSEDSDSDSEI